MELQRQQQEQMEAANMDGQIASGRIQDRVHVWILVCFLLPAARGVL